MYWSAAVGSLAAASFLASWSALSLAYSSFSWSDMTESWTPSMSMASVVIRPVKPISSRSRSVRTALDVVAGWAGSMASTTMWAVMIMSTPPLTAARKGARWVSRVARS